MKKLAPILLVFTFVLPPLVSFFWLKMELFQLKKEVKHELKMQTSKSDLVHFVWTKYQVEHELEWEDEKEFKYQGQMYDVVFKEKHSDNIEMWCWLDTKETELSQKLEQTLSDFLAQKTPSKNQKKAFKLLSSDYLFSILHLKSIIQWFVNQVKFTHYQFLLKLGDICVPTLPPKALSFVLS